MPTTAGTEPVKHERPATDRRQDQVTAIAQPAGYLTVRYGAIGIPAVAAALRYTEAAKNPAYAPVVPRPDLKRTEMAAA